MLCNSCETYETCTRRVSAILSNTNILTCRNHIYMEESAMTTWKTAAGELLPIDKMDEAHITNCISMLERKIEETLFKLANLQSSITYLSIFRGELAKRCADKEEK